MGKKSIFVDLCDIIKMYVYIVLNDIGNCGGISYGKTGTINRTNDC